MSNTYIGHSRRLKCSCGYVDTPEGFKDGCPYCGSKSGVKKNERI